jgi:hypothetical protein
VFAKAFWAPAERPAGACFFGPQRRREHRGEEEEEEEEEEEATEEKATTDYTDSGIKKIREQKRRELRSGEEQRMEGMPPAFSLIRVIL